MSKHIVKTYGTDGLIRTTTYTGDGLMLRKDWADGRWETFSPFFCLGAPSPYRFTYRNGDGAKLVYEGMNTRQGDKIVNEGGFVGDPPFNPVIETIGRFNTAVGFTEGSTTFKVTKYEDCGSGSRPGVPPPSGKRQEGRVTGRRIGVPDAFAPGGDCRPCHGTVATTCDCLQPAQGLA